MTGNGHSLGPRIAGSAGAGDTPPGGDCRTEGSIDDETAAATRDQPPFHLSQAPSAGAQ